jgi:nitroreductase
MNSFLELVKKRQSDRAYMPLAVEQDKIDRILEAAHLSPSACNGQPWKIVAVTDANKRHQIADAATSKVLSMNHFSKQAPLQLVVVEESTNFTSRVGGWFTRKHYPHLDLGILAAHICLAAADEGLGSCMLGWCDEKKVRKILDIPNGKRVMLVILIGYTDQPLRPKIRKPIQEIVSYNSY